MDASLLLHPCHPCDQWFASLQGALTKRQSLFNSHQQSWWITSDLAIIPAEKVRDDLLDLHHRRGGSKAKLLSAMGYRAGDWEVLADDLRSQHLTQEVDRVEQNDYGTQYIIIGAFRGPVGKPVAFRSVWQVDVGTNVPRFITMYPE